MNEQPKSVRERIIETHQAHPDWTARDIAEALGVALYHVDNARTSGLIHPAASPLVSKPTVESPIIETLPAETLPVPSALPGEASPSKDAIDITVFATRPHEMAAAQNAMVSWAGEKVQEAKAEYADATAGLEIAVANGWALGAIERAVNKTARMVIFYEKIEVALKAGYYIVPPFPIDIFTIRTNRKSPDKKISTSRWDRHPQDARLLPVGEGRYVARDPLVFQRTIPGSDVGPNEKDRTEYFGESFRDVAFPFALAKPQIMEATAGAMALKVFDQLGVLPAQRGVDPIICGQILKPISGYGGPRPVTFFIAWWLDTKTL